MNATTNNIESIIAAKVQARINDAVANAIVNAIDIAIDNALATAFGAPSKIVEDDKKEKKAKTSKNAKQEKGHVEVPVDTTSMSKFVARMVENSAKHGRLIEDAKNNTLDPKAKARITVATKALAKVNVTVKWVRIGHFMWLYGADGAEISATEFEKAGLSKGWAFSENKKAIYDRTYLPKK